MAKVILGTTMSIDGFMNDRHGSRDSLYPNLEELANPILLGGGLRFFDNILIERTELEKIDILESPSRTDLRFRSRSK